MSFVIIFCLPCVIRFEEVVDDAGRISSRILGHTLELRVFKVVIFCLKKVFDNLLKNSTLR